MCTSSVACAKSLRRAALRAKTCRGFLSAHLQAGSEDIRTSSSASWPIPLPVRVASRSPLPFFLGEARGRRGSSIREPDASSRRCLIGTLPAQQPRMARKAARPRRTDWSRFRLPCGHGGRSARSASCARNSAESSKTSQWWRPSAGASHSTGCSASRKAAPEFSLPAPRTVEEGPVDQGR